MSVVEDQHAFALDVARLLPQIAALGYQVTLGEAWRTPQQEQWDVDHGLSKTLDSKHLSRLAIDLNIFKDGQLIETPEEIGAFWEGLDPKNRWGGRWKDPHDPAHFERDP